MSKKKRNNPQKKTDEILDSLAEDVGADDDVESTADGSEDESEQTVADDSIPVHGDADDAEGEEAPAAAAEASAEEPVVPDAAEGVKGEKRSMKGEFSAWPCDPDHRSAAGVLLGEGSTGDVDLSLDDDLAPKGGMNFLLLATLFIVAGVGAWQFHSVSSQETLDAKRAERAAVEQAHMDEQLAKQKKYGTLRIESNPAQAKVFQLLAVGGGAPQWQQMTVKNEETQQAVEVLTPVNMNNMDIAAKMQFRVVKDGYEQSEFAVAEHLWMKDNATGEYKFLKTEELTPVACEFFFLYDMKKKREVKFDTSEECSSHHGEALANKGAVTDCTCKEMPVDEWLEREAKRKEEEEKKEKPKKKGK